MIHFFTLFTQYQMSYTKLIIGVSLSAVLVATSAFGLKYAFGQAAPPSVVIEMSKDILDAQLYVQEHEAKVFQYKAKAQVYREAICKTDKAYCTAEILDPLATGLDLSRFQ